MPKRNVSSRRRLLVGAVVAGLALVLGAGYLGCRRPPQMGASDEVFRTVDALFTAITARDEELLGQCERNLHAFRAAGALPAEASVYLDGIIQQARSGRWEAAAQALYDFMKVQRRESTNEGPPLKVRKGRRPFR